MRRKIPKSSREEINRISAEKQERILRHLSEAGALTIKKVAQDLRMTHSDTRNQFGNLRVKNAIDCVEQCQEAYRLSYSSVGDEDKSLQDYLHALEFTDNKYDMHNEALKLWQSRKARRRHKDIMLLNKEIAEYFADGAGKKFLNELRQLLGRQRKQEQYVEGQRAYHRRMPDKD